MDTSSWKSKPAAAIKAPRPASASSEDARDSADDIEIDKAKQMKEMAEEADKVGKLLNSNYYFTDWTFPFLRNKYNQSLSVSRFYPQTCVAVDTFSHITSHEDELIALKRKLFSENLATVEGKEQRVRYGALDYSMPLADLLPQIGESPKVGE